MFEEVMLAVSNVIWQSLRYVKLSCNSKRCEIGREHTLGPRIKRERDEDHIFGSIFQSNLSSAGEGRALQGADILAGAEMRYDFKEYIVKKVHWRRYFGSTFLPGIMLFG